jgi:hypothetical protein
MVLAWGGRDLRILLGVVLSNPYLFVGGLPMQPRGYEPTGPLSCSHGHFSRPLCEPAKCTQDMSIGNAVDGFTCGIMESGGVCHLDCKLGYDKTSDIECWHGQFSEASCVLVTSVIERRLEAITFEVRIPAPYAELSLIHQGGSLGAHLAHMLAGDAGIQPERLIERGIYPRSEQTSAIKYDILAGGAENARSGRRAVHHIQEKLMHLGGRLEIFLSRFAAGSQLVILSSTIGKTCETAPVVKKSRELAMSQGSWGCCRSTLNCELAPLARIQYWRLEM